MFRLAFPLVLTVTLSVAVADEKPKSSTKLPADECLFLLYALDDFYRDTWIEPDPANAAKAWYSRPVSEFVGRRTAVVGDLMQYMRRRGAPAELIDAYGDYLTFLRSGNSLAAKLREREEKHLKFYRDLRQRLLTAEQIRQLESNLGVLHAATDAIRGLTEDGAANAVDGLMSGQAGGLVAARVLTAAMENKVNADRLQEWERAKQDAADYEKQEGPTLTADLTAIRTEFLKASPAEKERYAASGTNAGRQLVVAFPELSADDAAFLPAADERKRNPFVAKRTLARQPHPKTVAEGKEYFALASKCFSAADAVPSLAAGVGKHDPYRPFRANFAAAAGTAANVSAGLTAGGGFAAAAKFRAPNPAAELAQKAWQAYRRLEPAGRLSSFHHEAVALAYAGQPEAAYRLLSTVTKESPDYPNAEFWYDAARIAAASGKPADAVLGMLRKAARFGFADVERVRADPDLEPVRQRHGPAVEQMLAPKS